MRRALFTALAACFLVTTPAQARTLPSLFARQIRAINAAPHAPPVLLPRSMPLDAKNVFASGGPLGASYSLSIASVPHCGDANVCFVAAFTAARARTVYGRRVTVRGASKAGFVPLSCGASCSPPQIDFIVHGIRYTIQAKLNTLRGDRAALIGAAEAAIRAGPR